MRRLPNRPGSRSGGLPTSVHTFVHGILGGRCRRRTSTCSGGATRAVNRGDIDGLLAAVDADVEFTSLIAEAEGQTFHGHDGVRRWWTEVVLPLGGLHGELEEVRDLGHTVIARVLGTYRPRGVEVRQVVWNVVRFNEGRATWWQFFRTEEEALEAAGESE
jgi:ketosteroid isomerase-like protein